MRDNPFHSLLQVLTGQIHDQLALGPNGWLVVILAWLLFVGGIAIALVTWVTDPSQRTGRNLAIFAMRFIAAGMWYLGTLWKLPWPVAHGFKDWLTNTVTYSSFQWHADFMNFFLTNIAFTQPLVYLLELFFAVSLSCGFAVRFSGTVGALFIINLLFGLYNDPTEWVWTYVGLAFMNGMFALDGAGRSLGLDHLLVRRRLLPPALARLHGFVA